MTYRSASPPLRRFRVLWTGARIPIWTLAARDMGAALLVASWVIPRANWVNCTVVELDDAEVVRCV